MTKKEINERMNRAHELAQNELKKWEPAEMKAGVWDELKQSGSAHYHTDGGIQPIDLYKSMGILRSFAIASIIKYAARNAGNGLPQDDPISKKDMQKIKHYADLLIAAYGGE